MKLSNLMYMTAVIFLLLPNVAAAKQYYMTSTNTAYRFMDTSSLRELPGGKKSAWVISVNRKVQADGTGYNYLLEYYDCSQRKSAIKTMTSYKDDGSTSGQTITIQDFQVEYNDIIPDSIGEAEFLVACNVGNTRDTSSFLEFDSSFGIVKTVRGYEAALVPDGNVKSKK